ncbi:MAG: MRP family ATP-binding protein [Synechococcaceae bacterium WBA_2_066]|nr:MRP family ATP-binding protein [Synechococcaceae bacterium WB6_1A_059]NBP31989.1 MRP family ATP-binding protein [Synechococcaceae bacterium WB6_1B_055]NBQ18516.1 MRP family ATP-binding protein [Synechococcaceae bacterium WB5_2A_257]NBR45171.1 MRP family ATP-binding protein [Synechococcaceae bacterium WB5_2B_268]NBY59687.1 MRP family ATP-binding protein [Synechococcaceae bacterium LLD_019]NCU75434.1 MRP family ATP-binding protein [Synechococcaceae bacterium WB7_1C_051]NCU90471.1 MRP family 
MVSTDEALKALESIQDAGSGRSLLDLGWINQLRLQQGRAVFQLALPAFAQGQRERIVREARELLEQLDGIDSVQIELGAAPQTQAIGAAGHGQLQPPQAIPGVAKVIAVSSGKGGVGKSTVAVNLACSLAQQGLKVGLLDADIYGPNAPTMLGVEGQTPAVEGEGSSQRLTPIASCGLLMVSMGLLINPDQPVVWRGPMLNGIIRQFLYQVNWGNLDLLVVDLPPGTGDAQLSLAQAVPMAGVVVVTTPQKVALQDARRGLAMFRQMNIAILGIVENMSWFIPPDQPERRYPIFGSGGGNSLAEEAQVPLLAQIPLELPVQQGGDQGRPISLAQPKSAAALAFANLAHQVWQQCASN